MSFAVDTSVLVAGLVDTEPHHARCKRLLEGETLHAWQHVYAETFASLTSGKSGKRLPPAMAADILETAVLPLLRWVDLPFASLPKLLAETERYGVRGGAVYDYLHLRAAKKAGASAFYTLNDKDLRALARPGDPQIRHPADAP